MRERERSTVVLLSWFIEDGLTYLTGRSKWCNNNKRKTHSPETDKVLSVFLTSGHTHTMTWNGKDSSVPRVVGVISVLVYSTHGKISSLKWPHWKIKVCRSCLYKLVCTNRTLIDGILIICKLPRGWMLVFTFAKAFHVCESNWSPTLKCKLGRTSKY